MVMSSSVEIMMLLIMESISVSHVAHFSTVGVAQFCIVGNNQSHYEERSDAVIFTHSSPPPRDCFAMLAMM